MLFTSLHELDVEEEAKRRFLLLPHYNKTFVTFATTTVEEQPEIALEFGVNATNLPRVCARRAQPPHPPAGHTLLSVLCLFLCFAVLFHRHGRNATAVEAGDWYAMDDSIGELERAQWQQTSAQHGLTPPWRTAENNWNLRDGRTAESTVTERTKSRMASRRRGGDTLGSAVKALLAAAGNPSNTSGTRIPSTVTSHEGSYADLEINENERFQVYLKLPKYEPHDEL